MAYASAPDGFLRLRMKPEAYQLLAQRQESYWWHRSRRAMAASLLRRYGVPVGCRWIDIGCAPGGNLHLLDVLHPKETIGVDVSDEALALASKNAPAARLIHADLNDSLPMGSGSIDVATI